MRHVKIPLLMGLAILTLGLTACQSADQKSTASFKNSRASSKKYSAPKPDAAVSASGNKKVATYHPTASQTKSPNYVKSGKLNTTGQYTFDKVGTELNLRQVKHPQTTIKSGKLTYRITTIRIIKNTAKTAAAKRMAADALDVPNIKSPYYTLQVKFTISNRGKQAVTTDGIKAIRLTKTQQLTAMAQLSDASAGKTIPARGKLDTFATGLASEKQKPTFKSVKIAFNGAYIDQKQVVAPTGWLKVAL